jgi:aerobic carbon-monoxide dehydrogenase medium subunit
MQVPAHVDYERPLTLAAALELLAGYGEQARALAGGHSLIPMMKLRLAQPELLVDIGRLTELRYIRTEKDELAIGALATHAELLAAPGVPAIFRDAERVIADPVVRNWGTIGGSLCQADPSEDLSAAFAAARASVVIRGRGHARVVTVRSFCTGPYQTVLKPGELLTELRVPLRGVTGSAYEKVARRVGDWSLAAVGAVAGLADGVIEAVGIGVTAVGAPQFCVPEAEAFLVGNPPTKENITAAGQIAADRCDPAPDQRGPVDYKRHLVAELTVRALTRACASRLPSTEPSRSAMWSLGYCSCISCATSSA